MNNRGVGGEVDGGRELSYVEQQNPQLGALLRRVLLGVNTLSKNTGASATGEVAAPKAPDSVNTAVSGEMLHVSISHGGQLQRGVQYFTEISPNDPSFSAPIVYHHGSSRTPPPIPLPTKTAATGNATHNYYVRSYAQYSGSQPSAPTVFGGSGSAPVAIQMTGSTIGDLLPSTGSGTAANTGQQGGSGLGKVQQRA